jgi:GH35 family endo-1,4-beta-xylanase
MSSDDDSEALFRRIQRVPTIGDSDLDDDNNNDGDGDSTSGRPGGLTLRQTATLACKRIDIGTAILPKPLFFPDVEDLATTNNGNSDAPEYTTLSDREPTLYATLVQQEFNAVVIEHHLKWAPLVHSEPGPLDNGRPSERFGRYDFYHADSIMDWCLENNIRKIKGHVLVWHVTTPKFVETLSPSEVRQQLQRHIFTCMGHFRGRITTWDVVNEALAPDGSLAENVFYTKLGPSYIEECFRWAHEADPTAILLYNDNKVEGIGNPKADGFYNLLADLKAKNVPVHGCGIQAHFNAAGTGLNRPPTPRQVKQQIHRLGELGLSVNISEMDVRVSKLPDASLRDVAQRQIYHDILAAALSEPAFDGIWLWGFTDRHTWVHSFYYDDEPCILDEAYERKEAYYGVRDALRTLTPGHCIGGETSFTWLDADVDSNGHCWGHAWMQPDEEDGANGVGMAGTRGDSRPDWEQPADDDDGDADDENEDARADGVTDILDLNPILSTDSDYLPPIL